MRYIKRINRPFLYIRGDVTQELSLKFRNYRDYRITNRCICDTNNSTKKINLNISNTMISRTIITKSLKGYTELLT